VDRSVPVAVGILVRLALAGVVGLIAVIVAIYISLRVGRGFIRRLGGLRAAALELAGERLPAVVTRLRRGEQVDVAREAPPLEFGDDELGQVGQAFGEVQRTAVASAVDEATLRRGLSEVFLNIARRSQTLLHRQLALLDRMERRTTDPDELADLFRIDHMATRMRRHAEDLVVLAGAAPGRGWRVPVPMIDVLRGAVSEVEDYPRVSIMAVEPAAVVGRAVGDVIHLLAELIENATSFSPPHTRVHIAGQVVPNGYAIEIEDRGLGMLPEAIEDANRRLADPPDFDPANSARLGLFVVAQLAHRHNVRTQLRPSPYGGVTAVALLPGPLVVAGAGALALPAGASAHAEPASNRPAIPAPTSSEGTRGRAVLVASAPTDVTTGETPLWTVSDGRPAWDGPTPGGTPTVQRRRDPATPGLSGSGRDGLSGSGREGLSGSGRDELSVFRRREPAGPGRDELSGFARKDLSAPGRDPLGRHDPATPESAVSPRRRGVPTPPPAQDVVIGEDGLPRRVRQTSLAPQLRRAPEDDPVAGHHAGRPTGDLAAAFGRTLGSGDAAPGGRTPEEVRARMSALQAGTARGRQESADSGTTDAAPPAPATGDSGRDA
jgi:signal transduction histidine kinase